MALLSRPRREPTAGRLETETAFVLATAALLDEGSSYADLSIDQIARKAGRSRSSFYVYFQDKRDLLLRAMQGAADRLDEAADLVWGSDPGRAEIRAAVAHMYSIYRDSGGLLGAVVEASGYDEGIRDFWRRRMASFIQATELRLLERGASSVGQAKARAFALVWMTERTFYQHLTGGFEVDDENLLDALAAIWEPAPRVLE